MTGVQQGYYLLYWGWILQRLGITRRGLRLLERALEIAQGQDQPLELEALNNLAQVYQGIGQPQEALKLYEQALPIRREVGDRAGEAATLNGMAYLYQDMQRYTEALVAFEQSVTLARQVVYPASVAAGLVGMALLLYRHLNRAEEAILHMEEALAVLQKTGLPQDAAGSTVEDIQRFLQSMHAGTSPTGQTGASSTMPMEQIQQIIANTIVVMTTIQDRRVEWRAAIAHALQNDQQKGADYQIEVDFFTAVLAMLDGQSPSLPADHPYAQAVLAIQDGIAKGGLQDDDGNDLEESDEGDESDSADLFQLIVHNTVAVLGPVAEKRDEWRATLIQIKDQATEGGVQELVALLEATIGLLDAGGNPDGLGTNLTGIYAQTWQELLALCQSRSDG